MESEKAGTHWHNVGCVGTELFSLPSHHVKLSVFSAFACDGHTGSCGDTEAFRLVGVFSEHTSLQISRFLQHAIVVNTQASHLENISSMRWW